MLTESLELNFLYEIIAFVLNDNYKKKHNFAQLLIGHKYSHLKSGAFSLDIYDDCETGSFDHNRALLIIIHCISEH